jgi:putative phosphoribosyl transferase
MVTLAHAGTGGAAAAAASGEAVVIPPLGLEGLLGVPRDAAGVVLFAHGSGSSRFSPRNTYVARALQSAGLATVLFDLLTEDEQADRANVFDIALLATRLEQATDWAAQDARIRALPLGLFGSSTGAAAALVAAAHRPDSVRAVVSRGGRPDLAAPALGEVRAPTLLVVGGADEQVLALNREATAMMACETELEIVPGATHLFEEPGTLDAVVEAASGWFRRHLAAAQARP